MGNYAIRHFLSNCALSKNYPLLKAFLVFDPLDGDVLRLRIIFHFAGRKVFEGLSEYGAVREEVDVVEHLQGGQGEGAKGGEIERSGDVEEMNSKNQKISSSSSSSSSSSRVSPKWRKHVGANFYKDCYISIQIESIQKSERTSCWTSSSLIFCAVDLYLGSTCIEI